MSKLVCALLGLTALAAAQDRNSGYLGVHVAPLNTETRNSFRIPQSVKSGVLLTHVEKGSAAARAGLRVGDVLTRFGKADITSVEDLIRRVGKHRAGERVAYRLRRGTGSIEGVLLLGRRPAAAKEESKPRPDRDVRIKKQNKDDIDKRLDRVARQIEELRRRAVQAKAKSKSKTKPGGGLTNWLRREERALKVAKENGNTRQVAYHSARLKLLREMVKAGVKGPGRQAARGGRGNMGARFNRIEKKLDRILKMLADDDEDDR